MRPTLPLHKGSTFKKRRAFKHLKGSVWPEIVTGLFLLMSVAATIHLVRASASIVTVECHTATPYSLLFEAFAPLNSLNIET